VIVKDLMTRSNLAIVTLIMMEINLAITILIMTETNSLIETERVILIGMEIKMEKVMEKVNLIQLQQS
jgi:hypothetical protein